MTTATASEPTLTPTNPDTWPLIMRRDQVAAVAGVSDRTVDNWIKMGLLKSSKVGALRLINRADVLALVGGE